ncbi:MAG: hypothetical protein NT126_05255 [Bacteroidetes bacterium]|nr:hypothetical protein [Bacteroidota bacterium]
MIRKLCLNAAMLLFPLMLAAQQQEISPMKVPGNFSLGTRNTFSVFSGDKDATTGTGVGGQFRIRFSNKINSEWFADYITSSIGDFANRTDYHIGWSLMFYPGKETGFDKLFQPYLLAGHCFDYTVVKDRLDPSNSENRFCLAMQAGAGTHINLTKKFDFSLSAQYMLHFGKDLEAFQEEGKVIIQRNPSSASEGHLLMTISMNYKIANLW